MKKSFALIAGFALGTVSLIAGDGSKKTVVPPPEEEDRWKVALSMPAWLANVEGDIGINGLVSNVDVNTHTILRHIDMVGALRAEVSKGRFGVMADFLYLSLSDGIGADTVVKKVDIKLDQTLAELALRYRLIETPRGFLDLIGGVRYTNIFQQAVTQPDSERIDEASTALVDAVGDRLRTALSKSGLRELVAAEITERLAARTPTFNPGRPSTLPLGPLGGRVGAEINDRVTQIVAAKQAALADAVRTRVQAIGAAAQAAAQARVDGLKRDLSRQVAHVLESRLDARISRTDDWLDPFIGLRAHYDFSGRIYVTARGDVGGFGVGSDFTWQAEAALGVKLSQRMFAELGYRALGVDYDHGGLIYNTVTHGILINAGLSF